jgi:DNA-binding NarL/FixJ family response regulator
VSVLAGEPLRRTGILRMLDGAPGMSVHRFSARQCSDVVVADLTRVTDATMRPLIVSREAYGSALVVITDETVEADHAALSAAGATSIMHTAEATRSNLITAIQRTVGTDEPHRSGARVDLSEQLRSVRSVRTGTTTIVSLSDRETAVLRHLSEGLDTVQIMKAMNVSDRTVKYILWGVMRRFSLRNRVHAVAFAIRVGAI